MVASPICQYLFPISYGDKLYTWVELSALHWLSGRKPYWLQDFSLPTNSKQFDMFYSCRFYLLWQEKWEDEFEPVYQMAACVWRSDLVESSLPPILFRRHNASPAPWGAATIERPNNIIHYSFFIIFSLLPEEMGGGGGEDETAASKYNFRQTLSPAGRVTGNI